MTERPYSQFTEDELIVRDKLALSRTLLANERTVLAYLRTGLAFVVAGLTFLTFFTSLLYRVIAAVFLIAGIILLVMTPLRYRSIKKDITGHCAPRDTHVCERDDKADSKGRDS